mmetsp:Transcript_62959/g.182599  ORF Transcript_62959/g.182599 Transcript_62959/m.182599 type:complete len:210 (-) Transcript_62959:59-688(-)
MTEAWEEGRRWRAHHLGRRREWVPRAVWGAQRVRRLQRRRHDFWTMRHLSHDAVPLHAEVTAEVTDQRGAYCGAATVIRTALRGSPACPARLRPRSIGPILTVLFLAALWRNTCTVRSMAAIGFSSMRMARRDGGLGLGTCACVCGLDLPCCVRVLISPRRNRALRLRAVRGLRLVRTPLGGNTALQRLRRVPVVCGIHQRLRYSGQCG